MEHYTKAQEDFVEALLMLEESKQPLETTRVANLLHVSKPAVHQMGHELINKGLITRIDYGDMALTAKGRELAEKVLSRHKSIKAYLMAIGVEEKTAEHDCCLIEHCLSDETFQALVKELEIKKAA